MSDPHAARTASGEGAPPAAVARVRTATPGDAALLASLAAETFALACPPGTSPEDVADFVERHLSRERFADYLADPARVVLVAEAADGPVGYTMLVAGEPQDPDVAALVTERPAVELSKCYVAARHHGSGVAARLMAASLAAARDRGAVIVWLGVNQHNPRANRFYEKSGFRVAGTKRFRVGSELHDDFVLVRRP